MSVPGPVLGPCESWITGDDVAACCSVDIGTADASVYDTAAVEATMVLHELSGRQFTGICETTVRPCAKRCSCWVVPRDWRYSSSWSSWINDCGGHCGCTPLSQVKLAGYPVREITEVKIDGDVVDDSGYRLDRWRYLVRLDDPGPPVVKQRWPGCQNLALDDTEDGTFSVTYTHGVSPPPIALDAAAELGCRLFAICFQGGSDTQNALPVGVARIVRQGIEVDRGLLMNFLYAAKPSGLVAVDAFLAAYAQGTIRRRPAVWSPDVEPFPRRVGGG